MAEDQKKHAVAVRMKEADAEKLKAVAESRHLDKSSLARIIVLDYLAGIDTPPPPTRAIISDIPVPVPRASQPQHAAAARSSKDRLPGSTASSTALKRTR